MSIWEPITTVCSSGSPKYAAGLAALRARPRNSALRQRRMPGVWLGRRVARDRK